MDIVKQPRVYTPGLKAMKESVGWARTVEEHTKSRLTTSIIAYTNITRKCWYLVARLGDERPESAHR